MGAPARDGWGQRGSRAAVAVGLRSAAESPPRLFRTPRVPRRRRPSRPFRSPLRPPAPSAGAKTGRK